MKVCNKCNQEKEEVDFGKYKSKKGSTIYRNRCKSCRIEDESLRYRTVPGLADKKRAASMTSHFKNRYGLTHEDISNKSIEQKGKCAICGNEPEGKLFVDHCHVTNIVRGLLCKHCNWGLGHFKDSKEILNKAIEYLN